MNTVHFSKRKMNTVHFFKINRGWSGRVEKIKKYFSQEGGKRKLMPKLGGNGVF